MIATWYYYQLMLASDIQYHNRQRKSKTQLR